MIQSFQKKFTDAVDFSFELPGPGIFVQALIKFDSLPTTSEDMVFTVKNRDDSDFDTAIHTVDPSGESETSIVFEPDTATILTGNEYLHVDYDNTDGRTIGITLKGLDSSRF